MLERLLHLSIEHRVGVVLLVAVLAARRRGRSRTCRSTPFRHHEATCIQPFVPSFSPSGRTLIPFPIETSFGIPG